MSTEYDADVIVIGSGVLGSLAAWYLARYGRSVIMLEAGPKMERWQIVERFRNNPEKDNLNRPYPEQAWAPKSYGGVYSDSYLENTGPFEFKPALLRLVGGSTWHWAAGAWRYLPNDMKLKSTYGVGRDWPIAYDDLEPWYQAAEEALGVCGSNTDDQSGNAKKSAVPVRSQNYPLPQIGWSSFTQAFAQKAQGAGFQFIDEPQARASQPFDGRPACSGNNSCTSVCPTGAMYSGIVHATKAQEEGARLITNAVVFRLEKSSDGKTITAVHYRTPEKKDIRLTARYIIVAANGIETARLLLLSDVANSSDQVGRNIMDHTGISLTFLSKDEMWPGRGPVQQGHIMNWRDGRFRAKHAAIRHALGNAVPNLAIADRLIAQGLMGQALDEKIRYEAARWVHISTSFEMLPNVKNRITLSERKDVLGLPKPTVYYEPDAYAKAAVTVAKSDYRKLISAFDATVISDSANWQNRHNVIGSVIMGGNAKDSVVDKDCRTFDHTNLFLATTGVIPACSVVPPTLTGIALSLRIAQLIREEL